MLFYYGFPFTGPWGWFSALIGLLITIIIFSVIVRIIVRIVRGDYCCHRHHHHWDDPARREDTYSAARKILDERYAKGEISEEEYKRMRDNLR